MATHDFEAFLDALLAYESGVDPDLWHTYRDKYATAGAVQYWKLERGADGAVRPGRVVRDANGGFIRESLTYKQYFEALGVGHLVDKVLTDPTATEAAVRERLREASYAAMNMLGFVGYQIGEAALISAGYYIPVHHRDGNGHDTGEPQYYYGGADQSLFKGADPAPARVALDPSDPGSAHVWATSVNEWLGTFAGDDIGLTDLAAFRRKSSQDHAMRAVMRYNLDAFVKGLLGAKVDASVTSEKTALAWALGRSWDWTRPVDGTPTQVHVRVTMSGILAATHLVGPLGLVAALGAPGIPSGGDETGTSPLSYLERFAGYRTPFDSPRSDSLGGVPGFDEVVTAGWVGTVDLDQPGSAGTDVVELGTGGHRTVELHREPGGRVDLHGFDTTTDKLRLVGFPEVTSLAEGVRSTLEGEGATQRLVLTITLSPSPQTVTLVAPKNLAVPVDLSRFVTVSRVYTLTSWYTQVGTDPRLVFNPAVDVISGPQGIAFGQLFLQETKEGTRIRFGQEGGGVNTAATLLSVRPGQLSARNFVGFAGSYTQVVVMHALTGFAYVIDWVRNDRKSLPAFDPDHDYFVASSGGERFSAITLLTEGNSLVVRFFDGTTNHDEYVLPGVHVSDLSADNFDGFEGSFDDVKHA